MQCNSITQASSTDFGPNSDLAHVEVDEFLLLFLLEGVEQRLPLDVGCGVTKPAKKRSFYLAKNHISCDCFRKTGNSAAHRQKHAILKQSPDTRYLILIIILQNVRYEVNLLILHQFQLANASVFSIMFLMQ